jgi:hypothetical protein
MPSQEHQKDSDDKHVLEDLALLWEKLQLEDMEAAT